jgi:PPOX class probable F420-dependent enzyme
MGTNQRAAITLDAEEIAQFVEQQRSGTLATIGPNGFPHLVAMWYAVIDGEVWIETKLKSQKVANIRRNDQVTFLTEAGLTYDTLRGVSIEGRAHISEDADELWKVGVSVFERYMGPYSDEMKPAVEGMLNKRVAVRIEAVRTRSWDHRKLGMGALPLGGTTAAYVGT